MEQSPTQDRTDRNGFHVFPFQLLYSVVLFSLQLTRLRVTQNVKTCFIFLRGKKFAFPVLCGWLDFRNLYSEITEINICFLLKLSSSSQQFIKLLAGSTILFITNLCFKVVFAAITAQIGFGLIDQNVLNSLFDLLQCLSVLQRTVRSKISLECIFTSSEVFKPR